MKNVVYIFKPNVPVNHNIIPIIVGNICNFILQYLGNAICNLLQVMENFTLFSAFSSYKIRLKNCALLLLSNLSDYSGLQTEIPKVPIFKYLGVHIFSSIDKTIVN